MREIMRAATWLRGAALAASFSLAALIACSPSTDDAGGSAPTGGGGPPVVTPDDGGRHVDAAPDGSADAKDAEDGATGCAAGAIEATNVASSLLATERAVADAMRVYYVAEASSTEYYVESVTKIGGAKKTIAGPLSQINAVAVDATDVFFTTPGAVYKCPLTGCAGAPTVVASVQVNPWNIVVAGASVYYATDTKLMKCAVGGCGSSPTPVADVTKPVSLATNAADVFWTSASTGEILACPLAGCAGAPRVVASGQTAPSALAADATNAYWQVSGGAGPILACPVAGCGASPTPLAPRGGNGLWTLTDGANVYWGGSNVYRCAAAGCNLMPTQVATANVTQPTGYPIVVSTDASGFDWLTTRSTVGTADGIVRQCPACGCNGAPRNASASSASYPADVVTDGTTVFWIDEGQSRQGPATIYQCAASNCAATIGVAYQQPRMSLSSLIVSGTYLYFFEGGYFGSPGRLMRCPVSDCAAGATVWPPEGPEYSVGGTVSGLPITATMTLQNDFTDTIVVANGTFTFPRHFASTNPYRVTVVKPPLGYTCTITNGTGAIAGANVTNVAVQCAADAFTVGGTLTGLPAGDAVTLTEGATSVTLTANGPFTFPARPSGSRYSVWISKPPASASCGAYGVTGTVGHGNVQTVTIACGGGVVANGSIQGLRQDPVLVHDSFGEDLLVYGTGSFAFPTPGPSGTPVSITVKSQPPGLSCSDGFSVVCTPTPVVGVTLTGWLTGPITLKNNGSDDLAIATRGLHTFPTPASAAAVTVAAAPPDLQCRVVPVDATNVTVSCDEGANLSGLSADGSELFWVAGTRDTTALTGHAVVRLPAGTPPVLLASSATHIQAASTAVDAQSVYLADFTASTISRLPRTGGEETPIATGESYPTSLVRGGTRLYWATADAIRTLDLTAAAAAPTTIAPSRATSYPYEQTYFAPPRRLAIGGGDIYWVTIDGANYQDSLWRAPLAGGAPLPLVTHQGALGGGVALTAGSVFLSATSPASLLTVGR